MAQEPKDSEQMLNPVGKSTPDISYKLNTEGIITSINDAVTKYGHSTEELTGTHILEWVHPKLGKKAWEEDWRMSQSFF